jgi:poly(A) polymerase
MLPGSQEGVLLYGPSRITQPRTAGLPPVSGQDERAKRAGFLAPADGVTKISEPLIIPRAEHPISRALISENALKVLYRLKEAGYAALLVGGCVRDLMLGREPKDFDVVTDARPEDIRRLFRNARVIGRRFRLVHVHFGREIIEVATFRAMPHNAEEWAASDDVEDGEMLRDELEVGVTTPEPEPETQPETAETGDQNVFGTQEEDAFRRDFTINGLYYDIHDFSIVDYVGGAADLKAGVIRMIGDPEARYREDPVRMLRAVRFAAKLGLRIEEHTAAPIPRLAPLLASVPPARLFEEVLKLFHGGRALDTYEQLRRHGLFKYLFPLTEENLEYEEEGFPHTLVPQALTNTDARIRDDKPVTPAFLFAAMLWEPVRDRAAALQANGMHPHEAQIRAADEVLRDQIRHVSIPKRFSVPAREIWFLQSRFERRAGNQALRLFENKRFRAAYDFLLLRAQVGEVSHDIADWWTRFQQVGDSERRAMIAAIAPTPGGGGGGKRRRRRGRRRSAGAGGQVA